MKSRRHIAVSAMPEMQPFLQGSLAFTPPTNCRRSQLAACDPPKQTKQFISQRPRLCTPSPLAFTFPLAPLLSKHSIPSHLPTLHHTTGLSHSLAHSQSTLNRHFP